MLSSDLAAAINSSYGALYYSWLKIFDQFSGQNVWIPPSGHVAGVFAKTARDAETWFAPAGLNRGHLLTPLDVEYNTTLGERNLLYGSGNAVNPIVNFTQDGITVWGQRTLQRRATALDRVNVRMLLIYLKKVLVRALRQFVFEPNDKITRARVGGVCEPFLADVQARRGLYGFKVVCDDTNNSSERVDRNELWVSVYLKPVRAAEFVILNLVIMRTDQSFTASEVLAAGGVIVPA
jgi:phage tail sheath protein FI